MTISRLPGLILTALVALGWTTPALALTVAIVRPQAPPAVTTETIVRLSLELASVGFATETVDAAAVPGERQSPSRLAALAAQLRVDAVVAIEGEEAPTAVEVWAIDRATGRSVSRRLPFAVIAGLERDPETLAIRAMELLRSSLLEIDLTASLPSLAPSISAPPETLDRHPTRPERLAVDVGAAVVMSLGGTGPLVSPVVHVAWALKPSVSIVGALAGFGTRASIETASGNAQVSESYLLLGAAYRVRTARRLRPFVTVSAGALRTSVDGHATSPNQGQSPNQWSLLIDGGLGAALRLSDWFFVAAAVGAQVAEPYVAVRFLESVVATRARPNILVVLTVGAWL